MKICLFIILTLTLSPIFSMQADKIITMSQIVQEYIEDRNMQKFSLRLLILQEYYHNGAYEEDIEYICQEAKEIFSLIKPKENSLIIFDIDDTALYHFYKTPNYKLIAKDHPHLNKKMLAIPIKPILELYKYLTSKNFKIAFISGRSSKLYTSAICELVDAGYKKFEHLLLMDASIHKYENVCSFKAEARKNLTENYNYEIIACIGDRDVDLIGEYTGLKIKLPNYLY